MRPIASDSSAYYLLRYKTTRADGKFHDVQVSVKKPGVSVRTRKGYWAVAPDDEVRAALLRPRAARGARAASPHQSLHQAVVWRRSRRRRARRA